MNPIARAAIATVVQSDSSGPHGGTEISKLNAHSDEAARVLDLLGRVSLRLWALSGDASRAGNEANAEPLHDLSDECDAACEMLSPFVLNVPGESPGGSTTSPSR